MFHDQVIVYFPMTTLSLLQAPHPTLKKTAEAVTVFDATLKAECDQMLAIMYDERGIGLGANMVGLLKRIIVVDLQENGEKKPFVCINPKLTSIGETLVEREEASLCFPGVRANIKRPDTITVQYQDTDGKEHTLSAEGWLATVIQHEMEYLDGKTFLDNLSKMQRDRLMKKMQKHLKHMHTCHDPHCGHDH